MIVNVFAGLMEMLIRATVRRRGNRAREIAPGFNEVLVLEVVHPE